MTATSNQVPYDASFFTGHQAGSLRSARRILPRVLEVVPAASALDVGCGNGTWLQALQELGITDLTGLDGEYVKPENFVGPREAFRAMDLASPTRLGRQFDLVMSLEVAEHL